MKLNLLKIPFKGNFIQNNPKKIVENLSKMSLKMEFIIKKESSFRKQTYPKKYPLKLKLFKYIL